MLDSRPRSKMAASALRTLLGAKLVWHDEARANHELGSRDLSLGLPRIPQPLDVSCATIL